MPLIALLTVLLLSLAVPATAAASLDNQRDAFRTALAHAEAGRWDRVEPGLAALQGYPLLPDLRAAFLRSRLGRVDDAEVRAFLAGHPDLGFSASLRRQWAHSLARREAWADYLELYRAHYATRGNVTLDCHAFTARLRLGAAPEQSAPDTADPALVAAALERWLSPVSQPEACDPAFAWLESQGELTDERRRQRIALALEVGEFRLARWLARPLGETAVAEVSRWSRLHAAPAKYLASVDDWRDTPRDRALLLYGFQRLASAEPELAARRWPAFRAVFAFAAAERTLVDRRIALVHAWRHLPGAAAMLAALPADSHDADTRTWAVRLAIRAQDWRAVEAGLAQLDAATAAEPVWRYWRARMLEATGRTPTARPIYAALATERGYYSFMAADRLDAEYNWQHADTPPDEALLATLARRPDLVRARELFLVGLENHGRIEWQRAVARLAPPERAQAGILAKRWGWYSRAITAATGAGLVNDLDLRFPLPWRPLIEAQSERAGISSAWVYGVTRSESLFMPDASSGAGAVGLMQLMPATGRQTAPRAGVRFRGYRTLLDPEANVALGTTYLAEMLARYGNHRVLATAAYNAGPNRVDRWLPDDASLPADAWVDSMPYRETRGYVQRVLASEAVFQWRMSGQTVRITEAMQPVPPRLAGGAAASP